MKLTIDKFALNWTCRSEAPTNNKYFPETAWVSIDATGIVDQSSESITSLKAPSQELIDFAIDQVSKFKTELETKQSPLVTEKARRTTCLNCGIATSMLLGRGYCTDCHGEC